MAIILTNVTAKSLADQLDTLFDTTSTVKIYDGTAPTDADTALSGNTLLATLNMSSPAFGAASDAAPGALLTANAITDDSSADATGAATFFRCSNNAGTVLLQGSATVAGGGGDLQLTGTATITIGLAVSITSFTITVPES